MDLIDLIIVLVLVLVTKMHGTKTLTKDGSHINVVDDEGRGEKEEKEGTQNRSEAEDTLRVNDVQNQDGTTTTGNMPRKKTPMSMKSSSNTTRTATGNGRSTPRNLWGAGVKVVPSDG